MAGASPKSSPRRRPGPNLLRNWIPASAGMTLSPVRSLHLADRRHRRVLGVDLDVGLEAEPGLLGVEFDFVGEGRDEQWLEKLVIVGPHLDLADGGGQL